MRYLFWNTNKKDVDKIIYSMIEEYNPTIIALAEYEKNVEDLAKDIKKRTNKSYVAIEKLACRVQILINEKLGDSIGHCADHTNYTIKILPYNSYNVDHIVAFVHLPSKMQDNREKNRHLLEQITCKINDLDDNRNRKVIILGDFNLNPYEEAMTYLTGCNAVSSKNVAMRICRKDRSEKDKKYFYYYNPMWNFLGDFNDTNGTYYYEKTSDHSRYWNTFDQFVVSPALIRDIDKIEIIKNVGGISLGNKNGIPNSNISDHYPLYFKLGGK
jgi:exonuclease III